MTSPNEATVSDHLLDDTIAECELRVRKDIDAIEYRAPFVLSIAHELRALRARVGTLEAFVREVHDADAGSPNGAIADSRLFDLGKRARDLMSKKGHADE